MLFQINFKSGKPVYLQLVDQIKAAAAAGTMQTGEPIPSIRPLAEELRVNRNTIAKAYTELENQGIIETIPGRGCFIKPNHSPLKKEIRRKLLTEEVDQVADRHLERPGQPGPEAEARQERRGQAELLLDEEALDDPREPGDAGGQVHHQRREIVRAHLARDPEEVDGQPAPHAARPPGGER